MADRLARPTALGFALFVTACATAEPVENASPGGRGGSAGTSGTGGTRGGSGGTAGYASSDASASGGSSGSDAATNGGSGAADSSTSGGASGSGTMGTAGGSGKGGSAGGSGGTNGSAGTNGSSGTKGGGGTNGSGGANGGGGTNGSGGSAGATASSCKALRSSGATTSGQYTIDVDGQGALPAFSAFCDMTTSGGGWTEITLAIAHDSLSGALVAVDAGTDQGIDAQDRPYSLDGSTGSTIVTSTYHYTFQFPAGFSEFYLSSYQLSTNGSGTAEIDPALFVQASWSTASRPAASCQVGQVGNVGDVSFGAADNPGPTASFASEGASFSCTNCQRSYPALGKIYALSGNHTAFRIGWGEAGCGQQEGWYPWWSGTIRLR